MPLPQWVDGYRDEIARDLKREEMSESHPKHLVSWCDATEHFEFVALHIAAADDALVFTDPPFFTGKRFLWHEEGVAPPTLAFHDQELSNDEQVAFHLKWMGGYAQARLQVRFAVFGDMLSEGALRSAAQELGLPLRAEIILKEQGRETVRRDYRKGYFFEHIKLLVFGNDPVCAPVELPQGFLGAPNSRSVWTGVSSRGFDSGYPTEKSFDLASAVVKWLAPSTQTPVIDPFAGSGALIRAARQLGHPTIALDISQSAVKYLVHSL